MPASRAAAGTEGLWPQATGFAKRVPEQFDREFLRYVWDYPAMHRRHIPEGIARHGGHLRIARFDHDATPTHTSLRLDVSNGLSSRPRGG